MYAAHKDGKEVLVRAAGKTVWYSHRPCLADLYTMLKAKGDGMEPGSALIMDLAH